MCSGPLMGLRVQYSIILGKAPLPLLLLLLFHLLCNSNLLLFLPASLIALPESHTGNDHPSPAEPPPQSSPVLPPRSVSPSVMTTSSTGTKCKHSACQSAGSLSANTNFVNDFMSTSDGSSRSQTNTNSKRQKVTGAAALLATSEELKDFNSTVRDLISSKEERNRKERQERASSSERVEQRQWLLFRSRRAHG
jgi:hypothetical protein